MSIENKPKLESLSIETMEFAHEQSKLPGTEVSARVIDNTEWIFVARPKDNKMDAWYKNGISFLPGGTRKYTRSSD